MRDGGLRDAIEGGFFRYAVRRDWSEPHYERMLTDNALLLRAYAEIGDCETAAGIVRFLRDVLRRPSGAFGSAQDSESLIDGERSEGGYYALDAEGRRSQPPPTVDGKVLTGWNGLAIGALAAAGARLGEPTWIRLAVDAAEAVLAANRRDGRLLRASLDGRPSDAVATLEDHGGLADGLLEVALAAGRPDLAVTARELVDACLRDGVLVGPDTDPTLAALGVAGGSDVTEGAVPSGQTATASAAWKLHLMTGESRYRDAAAATVGPLAAAALQRPIGYGAALGLASRWPSRSGRSSWSAPPARWWTRHARCRARSSSHSTTTRRRASRRRGSSCWRVGAAQRARRRRTSAATSSAASR